MRVLPVSIALSLVFAGVTAWADNTQPPQPPSSETAELVADEAVTDALPDSMENTPAAETTEANALPADTESFAGDHEELIVAVMFRKGGSPLSDGMMAYAAGDDIALPLEQFMFLIEFPIQVSKDGRRAEGWFIRENQRFSLDLNSGSVNSNGRSFSIKPTDIRAANGDLYVPTRLLSQWFPLDIKSNLRALDVTVTPREAIAIDDREERRQKSFGVTYMPRATNPEHDTPYQLLTPPALDVTIGAGYNSGSDNAKSFTGTYTARAYADVAYMNGELVVFGNDKEITDARVVLSRRNPRGTLLGKLNATAVEMGDISTHSAPLIASSVGGRGVRIASTPAGYVGGLEKVTLEGPLSPGYDVELYRNNILINATQSGTGNQYRFNDLELFNGANEFRLEFYGPQGQRETRTERYFTGGGKLKSGEINYDVAISQPGKTVFGMNTNSTTDEYASNALAATAKVDYGVNSNISVSAGAAITPLKDSKETRRYGFGGVRTQIGGVFTTFDTAVDDKGGSAWSVGASTKIDNTNLSANYEKYLNDFSSNKTIDEDTNKQMTSRASVGVDSYATQLVDGLSVSAGLTGSQVTYKDGESVRQVDGRLTTQFKNLSVANTLRHSQSNKDPQKTVSGNTQANLGLGNKTSVRLNADYDISPIKKIKNLSGGINQQLGDGYTASLDYRKDNEDDSKTLSGNLSKDFKFATLGVSASKRSELGKPDNNSVFLTASFNTFTDPKTRKTEFSNSSKRNLSAIRTTTFLDENRDGIHNPDEPVIPDIQIRGAGRNAVKTEDDGQAMLRTSGASDWSDIFIDNESMPEANLRPANNGVSVLPRPGVVSEIALPIINTGDVEGTITLSRENGETVPLGNLEIQAVQIHPVTGEEEVVAHAVSAHDGFYSISGIPAGDVIIQIDPEQAARLSIFMGDNPIALNITKDNSFFSGQDFFLQRQSMEDSP